MKSPRPKRCRSCAELFLPTRAIQPVCDNFECKVAYANKVAEKAALARKRKEAREAKADRKVTRERKEKLKTRSDYIKEVQIVVNKYIRLRDADLPCISCSRFHSGQYHAGHFRSVGSAPHLRFEERNIYKQCAPCNNHLSGNLILFRKNLVERYGADFVEALESENEAKHYTIEQLKELKKHYAQKCKELVKVRESA